MLEKIGQTLRNKCYLHFGKFSILIYISNISPLKYIPKVSATNLETFIRENFLEYNVFFCYWDILRVSYANWKLDNIFQIVTINLFLVYQYQCHCHFSKCSIRQQHLHEQFDFLLNGRQDYMFLLCHLPLKCFSKSFNGAFKLC